MKKRTYIILAFPLFFAISFFLKTSGPKITQEQEKLVNDEVNKRESAPQKIQQNSFLKKDMAQQILKKANKNKKLIVDAKQLSFQKPLNSEKLVKEIKACPYFIKRIALFETHLREGGNPTNFKFEQNCPYLTLYGKPYESFKKACLHSKLKRNTKGFGATCGQALFMLKATHAELITKNVPLSEIFELEPLIYKYFFRLFGPDKRSSLLSISERVLELEPDLEEFKVLSLISTFEAMVSKRHGLNEMHFERMEEYFEDLLLSKEGKERESIYELKLLTLMHSKSHSPQEIERTLSKMETEVPNSSAALYYRANLKNQSNQREEALALLKQAINLSPHEKRYKFSYKELLKADKSKPAQNAFVFQLSFKGLPFNSI